MLKITGDGRRAALDLQLVGRQPVRAPPGKIATAADRIAAIHHQTRGLRYLGDDGQPHHRPGALQLVFCDVSTPAAAGWNAYDELRTLLAERGVPRAAVRCIHEAATDEAKATLFEACRDGQVAVVVGSTDKMGIGTNVQARAVALHHLDCPWRPADIEQRDGRILRQGNQNPGVQIIRYATEGSFDTYMWQTVERKAAFISQVATGRATDRNVDDIGDQALSYAEVKALASGDPLILEKASVDADVARLSRLERSHGDDQHRLRRTLDTAQQRAERTQERMTNLQRLLERRIDTRSDRFAMTIDSTRHTKRADAGAHLVRLCNEQFGALSVDQHTALAIGILGGLDVDAEIDRRIEDEVRLFIRNTTDPVRLSTTDLDQVDPSSLITRLERRVQNLDAKLEAAHVNLAEAQSEADRASARIGKPFEHAYELRQLRRRQAEINDHLLNSDQPPATGRAEHDPAERTRELLDDVPVSASPGLAR